MTRVIRTVRGDIAPGALGPCDAHDHLFLETPLEPDGSFQDVAKAIEEARDLRAAGASALVDWTPLGLGRNLDGLTEVSRATGLHVVAATGLHHDAHYAYDDPFREASVETLAERFVTDLDRCGVIKVGASYHRLQPFEQKAFEAAAEAHRRTDVPICVHTEHGTMGLGIVDRLLDLGVRPASVVLGHLDRNPDPAEHAEIASTGAWLEFDGAGRTKYWPDSTILALIADVEALGHGDRILLGGDTGRASMMRAYGGGPGLDYLFARFKRRLERELGTELAEGLFRLNPAEAFAFSPKRGEPDLGLPATTTSPPATVGES